MKDSVQNNSTDGALSRRTTYNEVLKGTEAAKLAAAAAAETPGDILALLSEDPSDLVKLAVGRNKRTPHHVVARLANHGSLVIRAGLAADSNTPLEILNVLAEDDVESIRTAAKNSRKLLVASLQYDSTKDCSKELPLGSLTPRWA